MYILFEICYYNNIKRIIRRKRRNGMSQEDYRVIYMDHYRRNSTWITRLLDHIIGEVEEKAREEYEIERLENSLRNHELEAKLRSETA